MSSTGTKISVALRRSAAILADLARFEAKLTEIWETTTASAPEVIAPTDARYAAAYGVEAESLFRAEAVAIRAEISKHAQKITRTPEGRHTSLRELGMSWELKTMDGAGGPASSCRLAVTPFKFEVAA